MEESHTNSESKKLVGIILILLVCVFPSYYIFSQNALEITFLETLIPMGASTLIGLASFFLIWLIVKKTYFAALLASLMMFCFLNFDLLRIAASATPLLKEHQIWGGLFFSAIIIGSAFLFLIKTVKKEEIRKKIALIVVFTIAGLMIFNSILAVPSIVKRLSPSNVPQKESISYSVEPLGNLPNIYYFILDEYGSFICLDKYMGYANKNFSDFLAKNNFSNSKTSFNRSTNTLFCLAENLELDYVCTDDMIKQDFKAIIENARWFEIMTDLGYEQYSFSTNKGRFPLKDFEDKSTDSSMSTQIFSGSTEIGGNVLTLAYEKSFLNSVLSLSALTAASKSDIPADRVGRVKWIFDYYECFNEDDVGKRNVIISYICSPHVPFAFDENGGMVPEEEKWNWSDTRYYLGQLKYVTKRLESAITNIITYDPTAIIIIQSDHGFRHHFDDDNPKVNTPYLMDHYDSMRILNAVYFGGKEINIEGLSGPNTLRAVLTKLGLDFPSLPETKQEQYHRELGGTNELD